MVSTKVRLIETARDTCRRDGWQAITTGSLCRALGLSQPAFYRHFPSLDALFVDLHVSVFEALANAIETARAGHDDPVARVRAAWRAYLAFALSEPHLFLSAFNRPAMPELEQRRRKKMERGLSMIREDMMRVDPNHGRTRVLEQWAAVHGLAELEISGRLAPRSAGGPAVLLERLLDTLVTP